MAPEYCPLVEEDMAKKLVIEWDGQHVPEALKKAPPGRYVLQAISDEVVLSEKDDLGVRDALNQLDANQGASLVGAIQAIQSRVPRR